LTSKKVPYIVTNDGRTIRYPDPDIKVNDTVKVDIATGKVISFLKFEVGKTAMVTKGRNTGSVGVILKTEHHPGSFDIVTMRDAAGNTFSTRLENVFVIGQGSATAHGAPATEVSLPKGKGVRLSILEERDMIERKRNKGAATTTTA